MIGPLTIDRTASRLAGTHCHDAITKARQHISHRSPAPLVIASAPLATRAIACETIRTHICSNEGATDCNCPNCIKLASGNHPDAHWVHDQTQLKIADARAIAEVVSKEPFLGNQTLIFIENLDRCTTEAANALLKILEEPSESTVILASASAVDRILPTIRSRAQFLRPEVSGTSLWEMTDPQLQPQCIAHLASIGTPSEYALLFSDQGAKLARTLAEATNPKTQFSPKQLASGWKQYGWANPVFSDVLQQLAVYWTRCAQKPASSVEAPCPMPYNISPLSGEIAACIEVCERMTEAAAGLAQNFNLAMVMESFVLDARLIRRS